MKDNDEKMTLTENEMLDLLDALGYDTGTFEDLPHVVAEIACNEGWTQTEYGKGKFEPIYAKIKEYMWTEEE